MNLFRRLFTRRQPQTFPALPIDAMIARRALRLHNRNSKGAAAYERIHAILGAGRG